MESPGTEVKSTLTVTLPSDNEILMTRTFVAPRELVWQALTKPEHIRNWYGFRGSTMPVCEMDPSVGGTWRFVCNGPDGQVTEFYGVTREVVPPERIVYTEIFAPFPDVESVVTTVLTEKDGVTHYSCTARYPTKEIRDMVVSTGMETGAAISLDRLAELLETLR